MIRSARLPATLLALALLVTACRKHEEAPPEPQENNAAEAPLPAPVPAPTPPAPIVEPPKPKVVRAAPAPEVPADQQVIDDADATGMTSRVSRGDSGGNSD